MQRYRCTRAVLMWCVFWGLILWAALRYGVLPVGDAGGDAGYLAGIYARMTASLYYQIMVVLFLGVFSYGVALLAVLSLWIRGAYGWGAGASGGAGAGRA